MIKENLKVRETVPFNFDEVYGKVSEKFAERGYDLEEGSNNMVLASVMSYLVSMLNANTAININETLLPLARKRRMVLQNARVLGYEAQHVLSFKYRVELSFAEGIHQINRYDKFIAGDKSYYYMGENIPTFEGPTTKTIDVVEGKLVRHEDDSSLVYSINKFFNKDKQRYDFDYYVDVPYSEIEDAGLDVFVTYYDELGGYHSNEAWAQADNYILDLDTITNKTYVRVDDIDSGQPRVYFNLGGVGKNLRENTVISVNVLISSGINGEIPIGKALVSTCSTCIVTSAELIMRGSKEESSNSIKKNAPLFYNSANRLVTKLDYQGFIGRDTRIKEASMWDGADEHPLKPGHIWLSYVPQHTIRQFKNDPLKTKFELSNLETSNWYMLYDDIQSIEDSMLPYNIPTLRYHHRQPIYFDFYFTIRVVRYNRSMTTEGWNQAVFDIINNYFNIAETYEFEYFQSNLDKRIDTKLNDDSGFNINLETFVTICKRDIVNEIIDTCSDKTTRNIVFHLGTPFEQYAVRDDGILGMDASVLPRITGKVGGKDLKVDFTEVKVEGLVFIYNIKLDDTIVGTYSVHSATADTIEVKLNIKGTDSLDTGLDEDLFEVPVTLNVKYLSPNFKFTRNTIPRLREVKMVTR